jgi:primosomal protein N' (replication factor Y)
MAPKTVDVLVPVALDRAYTYRVPAGLSLSPGDVVAVPLGPNEYVGVVWGAGTAAPGLHNRLKDIDAKLEVPPLREELRQFIDWVSDYTLGARGTVLNMALRMGQQLGPARERVGVRLAGPAPQRMTTARARVLKLLADQMVRTKADIAQEASVSAGVIDGLIDEGTLETLVLPPEPVAQVPDPDHLLPDFAEGQQTAVNALRETMRAGGFSATLIDGVTGSGKTEVYFEAVADNIRKQRQTLILMPEIALTTQFLNRFEQRFGVRPAEWHSQLSSRKRARTWSALCSGEVSVVVGARSALFLPYVDLGLIVVDEEHDPAYKQEDGDPVVGHSFGRNRSQCAARPLPAAAIAGAVRRPASAACRSDRSAHARSRARTLHRAAARGGGEDRARTKGAGAAVSQSSRLRAADIVPLLRLSHRLRPLRCLAGRS